jgi:hypothetical protein
MRRAEIVKKLLTDTITCAKIGRKFVDCTKRLSTQMFVRSVVVVVLGLLLVGSKEAFVVGGAT